MFGCISSRMCLSNCLYRGEYNPCLFVFNLLLHRELEARKMDNSRRIANITAAIKEMLEDYDIRLRPRFGGRTNMAGSASIDLTNVYHVRQVEVEGWC